MKQLTSFELSFRQDRKERNMPVQVFLDNEHTVVVLDCECCPDAISNKLPGGVMISIAATLRDFFANRGMKNISVQMAGHEMWRTYSGNLSNDEVEIMRSALSTNISQFLKKRK